MKKKILGIEIENDTLSAVLVENEPTGIGVSYAASIFLSKEKEYEQGIKEALEEITRNFEVNDVLCAVSIPSSQISFRNIQLPFKSKKKIEQVLPFESEPMLPYPVNNLLIDFYNTNSTQHDNHTDLLMAAVDKTLLKTCLDILSSFKIEPEIISAGGYTSALYLSKIAEVPENWVLVKIGTNNASLFIVKSRQIEFARSFNTPSKTISKTKSICINIQQTIAAYEEFSKEEFDPKVIYITGPGIYSASLTNDMTIMLETSVKLIDLVASNILPKKDSNEILAEHHKINDALSLAMTIIDGVKGINFRKGPFAYNNFLSEYRKDLIITAILALIVPILILLNIVFESHFMEKELTRIDNKITNTFKKTVPEVKTIVDPLRQIKEKMKDIRKGSQLSNDTLIRRYVTDILNDISKKIPRKIDVVFNNLVISTESVIIDGKTSNFNSVDAIKGHLEKITSFEKVTIASTKKDKTGNRVRFKLKIQL